ncbi:helix-turn-helix domain-containing protein [Micromonospora aurantiaca (nom. illeg.)]|uniref:helix-turn-helix domain-containing protein n=1 Tax=Micromonospora aurantiaca (nom. illeg.) TaxID=47850 RepID=UPI003DA1E2EE
MQRHREIDRHAWAQAVGQLVRTKARGNQTQFAALVGVTARTVYRWMNREAAVSEESVRAVARAVDINPMELLVRIGYYTPDEAQAAEMGFPAPVADEPPPDDEESIRMIRESDLPDDVKSDLISEIRRLQQQHVDERASFAQRLLSMARRVARPT